MQNNNITTIIIIIGEDCPRANNVYPSSYESTVVLHRSYKLGFRHSPPTAVELNLLYVDQKSTDANSSPTPTDGGFNYIMISICFPPGTTVTKVRYSWKETTIPNTSAENVLQKTYTSNWATLGDKMWYMDPNGLFTTKLVPYEARTEANKV